MWRITVIAWTLLCTVAVTAVTAATEVSAVTYPDRQIDTRTYPWVLEVSDASGDLVCTATLIYRQVALTAAHCLDGAERPLSVRPAGSTTAVVVDNTATHPGYDRVQFRNDLALLHLSSPLPFSSLPTVPSEDRALLDRHGEQLILLGYGRNESGRTDNNLHATSQRDISDKGGRVFGSAFDRGTMIAAGRWDGSRRVYSGACRGDSGGPLLTGGSKPSIVGVVSFGAVRCATKTPTVYTRVAAYRKWIVLQSASLRPTPQGVVDISFNGRKGSIEVTVSGAGDRKVDVRCTQQQRYVSARVGDGRGKIAPVTRGSWTCAAKPADVAQPFTTIGTVSVS